MSDHKDKKSVDDIDCMDAIEHLYAYLDGELSDPKAIAEFEKHLQHCENCFTRKEVETRLSKRMKNVDAEKAPESLQNRLKNLINKLD